MKLVIIFAAALLRTCSAAPNNNTRLGIQLNEYIYFSNTEETRSRADALTYCTEQGGELAQIWNRNLYNQIRVTASERGSYWIDGIDRPDAIRFNISPVCSNTMTGGGGAVRFLDFSGIPIEIPQVSCLSLVKGANLRDSRLEAANCDDQRFVICQAPVDGCLMMVGVGTGPQT